jgi:hypothetical protein
MSTTTDLIEKAEAHAEARLRLQLARAADDLRRADKTGHGEGYNQALDDVVKAIGKADE